MPLAEGVSGGGIFLNIPSLPQHFENFSGRRLLVGIFWVFSRGYWATGRLRPREYLGEYLGEYP